MRQENYPAIYRSADENSNETQNKYINGTKGYLIVILIGTTLGTYRSVSEIAAFFAAFVFIVGIILAIVLHNKQYERKWYNCRAVAESMKTSTWRFTMRANPYDDLDEANAKSKFRELIKAILNEQINNSEYLTIKYGDSEQITNEMNRIRSMELLERMDYYRNNRIDEQRSWYAKKAKANQDAGNLWFKIMIALHIIAIVFVLLSVSSISWSYWPSEIFIVAGTSAITWMKVRKYNELAAAYGLTAHEISTIRGELELVKTEEDFSQFVNNSENAFSREHTQWLARKEN